MGNHINKNFFKTHASLQSLWPFVGVVLHQALRSRPYTKTRLPPSLRHQMAIPVKIRPGGATITRL